MVPLSRGKSPVMRLNSVVFPAPFGPMMRRRSPGITSSDTPFIAGRPPQAWRTSARGSAAVIPPSPRPDAPPEPARTRHHPRGQEDHDEHEHEALQHFPMLEEPQYIVLQRQDDRPPDDRPRQRPRAAGD